MPKVALWIKLLARVNDQVLCQNLKLLPAEQVRGASARSACSVSQSLPGFPYAACSLVPASNRRSQLYVPRGQFSEFLDCKLISWRNAIPGNTELHNHVVSLILSKHPQSGKITSVENMLRHKCCPVKGSLGVGRPALKIRKSQKHMAALRFSRHRRASPLMTVGRILSSTSKSLQIEHIGGALPGQLLQLAAVCSILHSCLLGSFLPSDSRTLAPWKIHPKEFSPKPDRLCI